MSSAKDSGIGHMPAAKRTIPEGAPAQYIRPAHKRLSVVHEFWDGGQVRDRFVGGVKDLSKLNACSLLCDVF